MNTTFYHKYENYIIEIYGPEIHNPKFNSMYVEYKIRDNESEYTITGIKSLNNTSILKLCHQYKKTRCLINETIKHRFTPLKI
jgi:hypothetical protein